MIGNGHVLVAARPGSFGHLFDGIAPVGFHGVHVDVALNVGLRDQLGKSMGLGSINLAQIFA